MAKKNIDMPAGKEPAERSGSPDRSPHHEGPAGAGPVTRSKFSKEARDDVSEKEPGKSRGC